MRFFCIFRATERAPGGGDTCADQKNEKSDDSGGAYGVSRLLCELRRLLLRLVELLLYILRELLHLRANFLLAQFGTSRQDCGELVLRCLRGQLLAGLNAVHRSPDELLARLPRILYARSRVEVLRFLLNVIETRNLVERARGTLRRVGNGAARHSARRAANA